MSLKRICAAVALVTLFASCTHVWERRSAIFPREDSRRSLWMLVMEARTTAAPVEGDQLRFNVRRI